MRRDLPDELAVGVSEALARRRRHETHNGTFIENDDDVCRLFDECAEELVVQLVQSHPRENDNGRASDSERRFNNFVEF
jgi:hypothetical protein